MVENSSQRSLTTPVRVNLPDVAVKSSGAKSGLIYSARSIATPQILSDALANDAFPKEIHVETC